MGTGANFTSIVLVVQRSTAQVHWGLGRGLFESDDGQIKVCMIEPLPQYTNIYYFFVILLGVYRKVAKVRLDQIFQKLVN